jgi:hypothetical protein
MQSAKAEAKAAKAKAAAAGAAAAFDLSKANLVPKVVRTQTHLKPLPANRRSPFGICAA